jgi:Flp pilus assembly protein TadD
MVESVAWMTEVKNTLSGVCFLAAASAYLTFDAKREAKPYAVALLLFGLGLLAKSVIAVLPAALLVVLWWRRGRLTWRRDVVPLLPFLGLGAAAGLFTAWVERHYIGATGGAFDFTVLERCLIAGRALWFYLGKLLWPAPLIFIYPRWHIDSSAVWQYLFPAGFLLVAALFWVLRHRSRTPLAVLLYFAGTLFPALGFFNVYPFLYSFVADHFQYLASIGPITVAAAGIARGTNLLPISLRRPLRPALHGLLLSSLFLLTWQQSRMYSDAETLYRTTLRRNDDCWMAHTHLGFLLMEQGRPEAAEEHLRKALALSPHAADAHNNLGLLYASLGRTEEAEAHYQQALQLDPQQADAHNNLGILLVKAGRPQEAMAHYAKAVALHPKHAEVHYNLADLLVDAGRLDEAQAHYQKALELEPRYADAHNNLGLLLARRGHPDEAMVHLQRALALNPDHANAHNNLGVMLARRGRAEQAIVHYRRAYALDPAELDHLENLAVALMQTGQTAEAAALLREAQAGSQSAGDEARTKAIAVLRASIQQAREASRAGAEPRPE